MREIDPGERSSIMRFLDRFDAGRRLADPLIGYAGRSDVVVLALPRGGVPVAYEVARKLRVPLDVFLVRKLGVPGHQELAMGAIAEGGVEVLNDDLIHDLGIPQKVVQQVAVREHIELDRRDALYRGGRSLPASRPRGHPGRRWACDRIDDAGGGDGPATAGTRPYRRGRAGRRARDLREDASIRR